MLLLLRMPHSQRQFLPLPARWGSLDLAMWTLEFKSRNTVLVYTAKHNFQPHINFRAIHHKWQLAIRCIQMLGRICHSGSHLHLSNRRSPLPATVSDPAICNPRLFSNMHLGLEQAQYHKCCCQMNKFILPRMVLLQSSSLTQTSQSSGRERRIRTLYQSWMGSFWTS